MTNREITNKNKLLSYFTDKNSLRSDLLLTTIIASFIAFLKPFGMANISFYYIWLFWTVICVAGYLVYRTTFYYGYATLHTFKPSFANNEWLTLPLLTVLASLLFSLIVPLINLLFFPIKTSYLSVVPSVFPQCLVIGGFITIISLIQAKVSQQKQLLQQQSHALASHKTQANLNKDNKINTLMAKVPFEKRGKLLCLEMDDHYLNIQTDKGNHLVLMRFKDALMHTEDYPGMQTHRSWWVALDAIENEHRDGRKNLLKLTNGTLVPVSKTYVNNVKTCLLNHHG